MGEPETTDDFYDYCERCSTCTWCSWHGRCLAECVPSDFALGDTFAQLRADLASVRQERDALKTQLEVARQAIAVIVMDYQPGEEPADRQFPNVTLAPSADQEPSV
jgi:hypothetical protein